MSYRAYVILPLLLIVFLLIVPVYADKYDEAYDLYQQGKYNEALPLINSYILQNERSSSAWNLKGLILMNLGRNEEALIAYNKSIELKPNNYIAYNNKGLAHKHLVQYQEALDAFNESIRINPTYTLAYYNKGNLQMVMGRFSDAIKSLDSALSYDPHYANAWYAKGLVYQKTDEHEKALESFSRAIEEDPEYKEAWYNKGISFSKLGRNDEAFAAFSQALQIDPDYTNAKYQRDQLTMQTSNNSSIFPVSSSSGGKRSFPIGLVIFIVLFIAGAGLFVMKSRGAEHFKKSQEDSTKTELPPATRSVSHDIEDRTTVPPKISPHRTSPEMPAADTVSVNRVTEVFHGSKDSKETLETGSSQRQSPFTDAPGSSLKKSIPTHHDVFISYSSMDKSVADAVCSGLEARNIRCWIAPRDLLPGLMYQEGIIKAIEECKFMVFIFSTHSNNSPHIIRELTKAVSCGVIIIPFRIDEVVPSKSMEYLIGAPHWLDALTPPLETHILKLGNTIESLLTPPE